MRAFKFWGEKKRGTSPAPIQKSDTFDPTLIPRLKEDHQALLGIYGKIQSIIKKGWPTDRARYQKIENLLKDFSSQFFHHTMLENGPLYGYLRRAYKKDENSIQCVHRFKLEMNQIQKRLNEFLRIWNAKNISLNPGQFLKEFQEIGNALGGRIESEEERLYRMYEMIPTLDLDVPS